MDLLWWIPTAMLIWLVIGVVVTAGFLTAMARDSSLLREPLRRVLGTCAMASVFWPWVLVALAWP